MKNSNKSTNGVMVEQIANFLDSQSIQHREDASCESCGSKMKYREFHFWLAGNGMAWNIRLPVCAICVQPKVNKLPAHRDAA